MKRNNIAHRGVQSLIAISLMIGIMLCVSLSSNAQSRFETRINSQKHILVFPGTGSSSNSKTKIKPIKRDKWKKKMAVLFEGGKKRTRRIVRRTVSPNF